ncbi:L-asparaginase/N4-(beta-N-acetylglucosaminyl)-L-asparaginase [Lewinella marina]|uniref:Glycosylasparaginase n=1 Tax=Neolewinella marina TaxID=438751 RepID=A0A2G0CFJ9_9BACT|nr:N(4)-(beta-N-acetylglucosaminyl)-L-asparaginase [Neolewinella marina]NJB85550.1 L-asparaginase/N4-(beta-N-acetylglucosaminyl)-L-asparaginase [Neolewinella marina]PHK98763.1 glycosylasparaginase [Neolewinella marina]
MRPVTRRKFLHQVPVALSAASLVTGCSPTAEAAETAGPGGPVVISTWQHGLAANEAAWEVLQGGGNALDAAEAGVKVTEADPTVSTVGLGGRPDRDGIVTLDAAIMDGAGDCGSVMALQDILHPISVARRVMDNTPHVMLAGEGARQFALAEGFPTTNLLTEDSKQEWEQWKRDNPGYRPPINVENHDTIGLLALDAQGRLAAACTTSGAAYKYHGRVGDSPIVGAGLYADNEVGAATATGWGEAVVRACGSFLVVELMRQGHSPTEACRMAVERVIAKNPDYREIQVGFIALAKDGTTGGYCIHPNFDYAVYTAAEGNRMVVPDSKLTSDE